MTAPHIGTAARGRRTTLPTALMLTSTGRVIDLLHPRPQDVDLADIATALSRTPRFGGRYDRVHGHYSVAQHSVLVHDLMQATEARPYALLHDAHEAYVGDLTHPVKVALTTIGAPPFEALTNDLDWAIHARFGLEWPPSIELQEAVRIADLQALAIERRDLMSSPAKGTPPLVWACDAAVIRPPTWPQLVPLPAGRAEERFYQRFHALGLRPPIEEIDHD